MSQVLIASSQADAQAVEAVERHHAAMFGALTQAVDRLLAAAARGAGADSEAALRDLIGWCERELLPHAKAEEGALYPPARAMTEGRLLVEGMIGEHGVIGGLVAGLRTATDPVRAAATAVALKTIFESHMDKENELVLPLLAGDPDTSVAELLAGMHELLGEADGDSAHSAEGATGGHAGGHSCGCGEKDKAGLPELDVRTIPHAIRHATVFGALQAVPAGGGLLLVAHHDPLPLLAQINQHWPGAFAVAYEVRGPEVWRIQLLRAA